VGIIDRYLYIYLTFRTPAQSWSISPNTQYAEQLQSPTMKNNIILTWTLAWKFHNTIQSILIQLLD